MNFYLNVFVVVVLDHTFVTVMLRWNAIILRLGKERVQDLSKASAIINHFGPFVCLEQMSIEQSAQFCLVCVCDEEHIFFLERPFSDAISTISSSHFILFHLPGPDFEKVLAPL